MDKEKVDGLVKKHSESIGNMIVITSQYSLDSVNNSDLVIINLDIHEYQNIKQKMVGDQAGKQKQEQIGEKNSINELKNSLRQLGIEESVLDEATIEKVKDLELDKQLIQIIEQVQNKQKEEEKMDDSVSESSEVNAKSKEYKVELDSYQVKGIIHHQKVVMESQTESLIMLDNAQDQK